MVTIEEKTEISTSEKSYIENLWNSEFPAVSKLPENKELDYFLKDTTDHRFYFLKVNGELAGWGFKFKRYSGTWFVLAVERQHQSKGLGSKLLSEIKKNETEINCWSIDENIYSKTDGTPYRPPNDFLKANGLQPLENIRGHDGKVSAIKFKSS